MSAVVLEKRNFPRVNLPASGLLGYREARYGARLENISIAGALITLQQSDCPDISRGERCTLALYLHRGGEALRLTTRMVHFGFDMACVRFVDLDQNTRLMLRSVIAHQLPERHPCRARN